MEVGLLIAELPPSRSTAPRQCGRLSTFDGSWFDLPRFTPASATSFIELTGKGVRVATKWHEHEWQEHGALPRGSGAQGTLLALFRRALAKEEKSFVSDVVLCEVVWVLEDAYHVPRGEIADLLTNLIHAKQILLGEADVVYHALDAFRQGRGDFADYVIRERAMAAGCASLATFEKQPWAEPGFVKL